MTDIELERIAALLKASGLAGKEYEVEEQTIPPYEYDITENGNYIAQCASPLVAEFYTAAPAAVGALLEEITTLRKFGQTRIGLGDNG